MLERMNIGARKASLTEARIAAGRTAYKSYKSFVGYNVWLHKEKTVHKNKVTGEERYFYWDFDVFPWSDAVPCPALVLAEYPNYILVRILPHLNPNSVFGQLSHEYTQTIHKSLLDSGRITMKRIDIIHEEEEIIDDREILF